MSNTSKSRVSYSKEIKEAAKERHAGLVTVSVTTPDGQRTEYQGVHDPPEYRFLLWALAVIENPEARPVPDLEKLVVEKLGLRT